MSAVPVEHAVAGARMREFARAALRHAPSFSTICRAVSAFAAAMFLARVLGDPWPTKFRPFFPDSSSYMRVARLGPFNPRFWLTERPPGYTSLLWLTGRASRLTVIVQALIWIGCWVYLCKTAIERLGRVVGSITALALGSIAFQGRFAFWTVDMLSESISLSVSVLVTALWWQVSADPSARRVRIATAVTVYWMLIRDSNAAVSALTAVGCVAVAWIGWRGDRAAVRRLTRSMLLMVVVLAYTFIGASTSTRIRYAFPNNIGLQVLTDVKSTNWFVKRGMPLDDALRSQTGRDAFSDGERIMRAPEFKAFRDWQKARGQRAFYESLVLSTNWVRMIDEDTVSLLGDDPGYDRYKVKERLPHGFDIVTPRTRSGFWTLTIGSVALGVLALAFARRRGPVAFALLFVVSSFGDLYLSFTGDGGEVWRHTINAVLRLAVGLPMLVAISAAAITGQNPSASRKASTAALGVEPSVVPA